MWRRSGFPTTSSQDHDSPSPIALQGNEDAQAGSGVELVTEETGQEMPQVLVETSLKMIDQSATLHTTANNHAVKYHNGTRTEWILFSKGYLAEAAQEAIDRRLNDKKPVTVALFMDRFVELHVLKRINSTSTPTYLRHVEDIVGFMGEKILSSVTVADVQAFIEYKRDAGLTDRQITPVLNVLSSALSTAKKWRYIDTNPVCQIGGLLLGVSEVK